MADTGVRIGVVGATGFDRVRGFASARSAGREIPFGDAALTVEEATPAALAAGDLDLVFFSVGTDASRELVPHAVEGGAVAIDKSDAYRLTDGVPLVVAGVNDDALNGDSIVANPNCSAMQLSCVLKPLADAAGLARVRLSTYQSMSGAGDAGIERLRATEPMRADLQMDWDFDGEEFSEEWKLRAETRKILDLPELPLHATCVRVPVLVGHAQAVWVETERPLSPEEAAEILGAAPHVELADLPTPGSAAGKDVVQVGRVRRDATDERGLSLWIVNDNLRKGAALNAVQIAETLLARRLLPV
jgi:aspartate-semialdehyde dehydrogenase